MLRIPGLIFLLLSSAIASAQSSYLQNLNESNHLIDRLEIRSGKLLPYLYTTIKPYERRAVAQCVDSLETSGIPLSKVDYFNLSYLLTDNLEWTSSIDGKSNKALLKHFYSYKPALFAHRSKELELFINPVLYFGYGRESDSSKNLWQNTRGLEVRALIYKKIGFYTMVSDNQAYFPSWYRQRIDSSDVVPGEGYYKSFKQGGYDFFQARGYITFAATPAVHFQFGNDRNFIGNGIRSVFLSDHSKDYLFLKINTRVWKFNYQNLFAALTDYKRQSASNLYGRKYLAMHHLSMNLGKNLNVGLFEAVIYDRSDSAGRGRFDLNYLNPVIFYRSVEQNLNSGDNAFFGADFKWNFLKHFSLYGQLLFDEFRLEHVRAFDGWWANKQAVQLGMKYIDAFNVHNLDLQVEGNLVRPFTYTHFRRSQNYIHFNQPLAHPAGTNFYEISGKIRYQPYERISAQLNGSLWRGGRDTSAAKLGGNILADYNGYAKELGNKTGQGASYTVALAELQLTWMPFHNGFIDLRVLYRKSVGDIQAYNFNSLFISTAFRMNIAPRPYNF